EEKRRPIRVKQPPRIRWVFSNCARQNRSRGESVDAHAGGNCPEDAGHRGPPRKVMKLVVAGGVVERVTEQTQLNQDAMHAPVSAQKMCRKPLPARLRGAGCDTLLSVSHDDKFTTAKNPPPATPDSGETIPFSPPSPDSGATIPFHPENSTRFSDSGDTIPFSADHHAGPSSGATGAGRTFGNYRVLR